MLPSEVLLNNTWKNNYALLEKFNLSFDLHLYWNQYQYAFDLIKLHPNILNIIDHAGTPRQRGKVRSKNTSIHSKNINTI